MVNKILIAVFIFISMVACKELPKEMHAPQEEVTETPEVLNEEENYSLKAISGRYGKDLIMELYEEALEKNSELMALNELINNIGEMKDDSLSSYRKYVQTNNNYWRTVDRYVNEISDTLLQASTREITAALEKKYRESLDYHEDRLVEINEKTNLLKDQLILMKLFITEPMMRNYQLNEVPDINSLERIINEYDILIEESKSYSKQNS